jgi:hypothetical protein
MSALALQEPLDENATWAIIGCWLWEARPVVPRSPV